ncbi:MAG: alkaline phosphatase [Gammaproteobacteria bacterium]|nr:alkaline phosphatase [Gammaproteobacteria bacterium]
MTLRIDRRQLIHAAIFGLGALSLPAMASVLSARGFSHGVASGEPDSDSVLLWTRFVAEGDVRLKAEIARDIGFTRIVSGGEVIAEVQRDYTARLTVRGLEPGRWYFYRFIAPDGSMSVTGRTRTLPVGEVSKFGIGLFSCSNLGFGWFNAYAHACERSDLDVIVHVGDYIYEYPIGSYPDLKSLILGRHIEPEHEIVSLADYRLRYASYRLDPDLQRIHRFYPSIVQWDDHEFTNDSWMEGAENHQPAKEGDWLTRRAVAERVYREWMPVSDSRWRDYQIGSLATLFKLETRISGRSAPPDLESALKGREDIAKALVEFREGVVSSSSRTMLGAEQEEWLRRGLRRSTAAKTRWQVLAQQVLMGEIIMPQDAANWASPESPEFIRQRLRAGLAASRTGLPYNLDSWGGFPAARARLFKDAADANADLVVLAGDTHNAWAQNLSIGQQKVGVEFATQSVVSPGFEYNLPGVDPRDISRAVTAHNPGLAYMDASRRGYTSILLTSESVTGHFHFLKTVRERSTALDGTQTLRAARGARKLDLI